MLSTGGCTNTKVGTLIVREPSGHLNHTCTAGVQVGESDIPVAGTAKPWARYSKPTCRWRKGESGGEVDPAGGLRRRREGESVPRSTEILMLGVRLTFAGKSGGPALVPLPQPVMLVNAP